MPRRATKLIALVDSSGPIGEVDVKAPLPEVPQHVFKRLQFRGGVVLRSHYGNEASAKIRQWRRYFYDITIENDYHE